MSAVMGERRETNWDVGWGKGVGSGDRGGGYKPPGGGHAFSTNDEMRPRRGPRRLRVVVVVVVLVGDGLAGEGNCVDRG